jgi:hypothetical protein
LRRLNPSLAAVGLAALLVLAIPLGAGAAEPSLGHLTAASVEALDVTADGPLAGFAFGDGGPGTPSLAGTAEGLAVHVEAQTVRGRVAGNLGDHHDEPPVDETHAGATLQTVWPDTPHGLHVFPLAGSPPPQLLHAGPCLGLAPATEGTLTLTRHVPTQGAPQPSADLAGTQRVALCASPHLRLRGDALVVLWGANLTVSDAKGTSRQWSGQRPDPADPGAPPVLENDRVQEIFLEVRGGDLDLGWGPSSTTSLYLAGGTVRSDALTLHHASGTLGSGGAAQAVQADRLELRGTLAATVGPGTGALALDLAGTPSSADADGHTLGWVVAGQPRTFAWGLALLVAGSIVVPAAGGVATHRAWSRRALASLEALLAARRHDLVVRRSRALARWSPFRAEALVLCIEAHLREGRAQEALAALRGLPDAVREGPLGQFLRGHILVLGGDAAAGALPLAAAAAQGPEFRDRIARDPLYRRARQEPALAAALAPQGGRPA